MGEGSKWGEQQRHLEHGVDGSRIRGRALSSVHPSSESEIVRIFETTYRTVLVRVVYTRTHYVECAAICTR